MGGQKSFTEDVHNKVRGKTPYVSKDDKWLIIDSGYRVALYEARNPSYTVRSLDGLDWGRDSPFRRHVLDGEDVLVFGARRRLAASSPILRLQDEVEAARREADEK